jgi:hypothetical protein
MAFRPARNIPPQSFPTDVWFPPRSLRGKTSAEWVVWVRSGFAWQDFLRRPGAGGLRLCTGGRAVNGSRL